MKKIIVLLFLSISLLCFGQKSGKRFEFDTIPKRTNPTQLDLKKNQLFIDTTRTSIFYKNIINWNPSNFDTEAINQFINQIKKDFKLTKISIKDFPKQWITLRKLNGRFILYDRCDGIDQRFVITDSTFNIYGVLESEADILYKLIRLDKDKIELEARTNKEKVPSQKIFISIYTTDEKDIFILDYLGEKRFITPLSKTGNFDLLVNHCPEMKVSEYDGLDN